MKASILAILAAALFLAGCAGVGGHDPARVCTDPANVSECRYGGGNEPLGEEGEAEGGEAEGE